MWEDLVKRAEALRSAPASCDMEKLKMSLRLVEIDYLTKVSAILSVMEDITKTSSVN